MSLKSKLSQLQNQAGSQPNPAEQANQLTGLKIPQRVARGNRQGIHSNRSDTELIKRLQGKLIDQGFILIEKQIPLTDKLGDMDLATLEQYPQLPGDTDKLKNIYLDTETTGLSGGSGTVAFLIGFCWIERSEIHLRQLLITNFSAEAKMLDYLGPALERAERLVSYNGKSYDLPLLISRFRLNERKAPFGNLPHLDLLHPTRRLFRHHWPDCRLTTLEQRLLGYHRFDDLPGSEAPAAWFDYLQCGNDKKLLKVIEHNQNDIVSLVAAHSELAKVTCYPDDFKLDLYSLARWIGSAEPDRARQLLRARIDVADDRAKAYLAQLLQKSGDWQDAALLWQQLAKGDHTEALERLAKYHEHISKNLVAAHHYCRQLPESQARTHRLKRLQRKTALMHSPAGQMTML
jgi:uncharacterized protein YprB with RNaseH-like and TPR domain